MDVQSVKLIWSRPESFQCLGCNSPNLVNDPKRGRHYNTYCPSVKHSVRRLFPNCSEQLSCLFFSAEESYVLNMTSTAACLGTVPTHFTSVQWNAEPQLSQHGREGSLPAVHPSAGSQHKVLITMLISEFNWIFLMYTASSLETGLTTSFCFCFVFWVWS